MIELLQVFWSLFISNILGYGGGPATIPLIQVEVVENYEMLTMGEFADVLALGNALPGPIATKMGGYIGFVHAGILGTIVGLIATVVPSALAMIILYKFVDKFKTSPSVKMLTKTVQPVIGVMMAVLAYQFALSAWEQIEAVQTILLIVVSFITLQIIKIHPAIVIVAALAYGAFFLS